MERPTIPLANVDTKPFWDGCADGKLLLQRCSTCGALRHPPSPICAACLGEGQDWIPACGRGTIYTYVVVRESRARGWEKLVPYILAVVDLEEGPRMLTNVINVAPDSVTICMPVEVVFAELDGTTKLPLFQPRAGQGARP